MTGKPFHRIEVGTLVAEARLEGRTMTVLLRGSASAPEAASLATFVARIQAEAAIWRVAEVRVDLKEMSFMNSSCFKAFVTWVSQLGSTPQTYDVRFFSSRARPWQARTLEALKGFAPAVVRIEST